MVRINASNSGNYINPDWIALQPDDLLLKHGETWNDTEWLCQEDSIVSLAAVYASDIGNSKLAKIKTKAPHCFADGDRVLLKGVSCGAHGSVDGCYTVASTGADNFTFELVESLLDGKGQGDCPICTRGQAAKPRDLTGYTVLGQVRYQAAGMAYAPSVYGSIDANDCEVKLVDCKTPCPALQRCQVIDIMEAGIKGATIVEVVMKPGNSKNCGNYVQSKAPTCSLLLDQRAMNAAANVQVVLNGDTLAVVESEVLPLCGQINLKLQTKDIPLNQCCQITVCADKKQWQAHGPYEFAIAIEDPDGNIEYLRCGNLYLQSSPLSFS